MVEKPTVHFDDDAILRLLQAVAPPILREVGEQVKAEAEANFDGEVAMTEGINRNGRPYVMVTLKGPHGVASQLKHGTLTRAAARQGLDIRRYDP